MAVMDDIRELHEDVNQGLRTLENAAIELSKRTNGGFSVRGATDVLQRPVNDVEAYYRVAFDRWEENILRRFTTAPSSSEGES